MASPRTRPADRKSTIVAVAARLFAEHGFAGVGIDDIGAAVGITGPAIYRHFRGKDALLAAVVVEGVKRFAAVARSAAGPDGAAPLEELVASTVAAALDDPHALGTYLRERRSIGEPIRGELSRHEQELSRVWQRSLEVARPDLTRRQSVLLQRAAMGEVVSIARGPQWVPRPELDQLVGEATLSLLFTHLGDPRDGDVETVNAWTPPVTRREEILSCALRLFRERSFHGVGIDEVGEAAGTSGPAVYRYFESKTDILVAAFERAGERVVAGAHDAVSMASSSEDALERLVDSYSSVARDNVDLIVVTTREIGALPEDERVRTARRGREVRELWRAVLAEVRPELTMPQAKVLVAGAIQVINALVQVDVAPRASEHEIRRVALAFLGRG